MIAWLLNILLEGSVCNLACNYNNFEIPCLFGFNAVNFWVELFFLNALFMSVSLKV